MKAMNFLYIVLFFALLVIAQPSSGKENEALSSTQSREWTILVFMNGKNNLERFAVKDFLEMAEVGSTNEVAVVVEMGRIQGHDASHGNWVGTKRFLIGKGMKPVPSAALHDLGSVNMGSELALKNFIEWGTRSYPAKRQMLIIWDHGQGWRLFANMLKSSRTRHPGEQGLLSLQGSGLGGYRSISTDDEYRTHLFNADIRSAIATGLQVTCPHWPYQ